MTNKHLLSFLWAMIWVFMPIVTHAQQDSTSLLDLVGGDETTEYVSNAFKSTRVINGQSMEVLHQGVLDFRILHRMGEVNQGFYGLFGLDQASMRMGFDYGINKNLMVGVGRSTYKKEYDGFVKYRIFTQSKGKKNMPVSVLWVSGLTINSLRDPFGSAIDASFANRLGYYHQVIIGRKINENLTIQLSPTWVHRNLITTSYESNDMFALGIQGRYKFTRRVALVWDYFMLLNHFPRNPTNAPFSLGFDIETGGHVFQLHFSNAVGMNERAFISDANGNWFKGGIRFGFNLSRVFQVYNPHKEVE